MCAVQYMIICTVFACFDAELQRNPQKIYDTNGSVLTVNAATPGPA